MKYYTDPFHFGKSVGESHSTTGTEESITSLEEQLKKLEELKKHNDTVFTEESLNSFITITKAKLQLKRALEEKEVDNETSPRRS